MKTMTVTLTIPCGSASAQQVMGAFDAFAAQLAHQQGWTVKASTNRAGKAYDFQERYVADHSTVVSLADRRKGHFTSFTHTTPPTAA